MKFSEYVNEGPAEHRKEITEHRFLELLRGSAKNSHAVAKKNPIYRKDKGPDMMLVSPSAKEEKSKFWIDRLITQMSSWKRYPSRTHYVRGYTDMERAGGNSDDIYVIIPLDTTRVGVCPSGSFYRSFEDVKKSMMIDKVDNDSLTDWLSNLVEGLSIIIKDDDVNLIHVNEDMTFTKFMKMLEKIDLVLKKHQVTLKRDLSASETISEKQSKILKDLISRHVSTIAHYLREKFDPETNGFTVAKVESLSEIHAKKEVWIDSPCLFIKRSKYIELHKQGDIK